MKYSVIIPVYNAERTLRRCLDRLLPQLNSDIEVLLINDGSEDESERICQEYETKSSFIKCFTQKNSGVSVARNKGIDNAEGEYLVFVDSDDYISKDYFETVSHYLKNNKTDLLLFSAMFLSRTNTPTVSYGNKETVTDTQVAKRFLSLYKQNNVYTLWNKVFSKRIIDENNIRFDSKLHIGEDAVFIFQYFLYAKKVTICEDVLYYVDESNQNSLSRKRRENLCEELITATGSMEQYLDESSQDGRCYKIFKRCITWGHYRGAYACFHDIIGNCSEKNEINEGILKVCDSYRKSMVKPIGFSTVIISLPVIWKLLPVIKLLFYVKKIGEK